MGFHDSLGRIFGIAVIDIVGTLVIALLLRPKTWSIAKLVLFSLALGELAHLAFGIQTPVTRFFLEKRN